MGFLKRITLCVVVSSFICGSVVAQGDAKYSNYALLVGSAEPGEGQSELRFAHSDVESVRAVLLELGGYSRDTIEVLKDPEPSDLYQALHEFRRKLEQHEQKNEDSVFLFFYSGHARSNALNFGSKDVPLARLRTAFENLPAKVKVVILDACQAGAMSQIKGAEPAEQFSHNSVLGLNTEGMAVMASSTMNELSQESEELGGSYFTHHLVVGLRGAADKNSDGMVALSEAYQYAYNNTLVDTAETAVGKQHVTLETELKGKGEMVLTWPAKAGSKLIFPARMSAQVLIFTEPERVVVAEVHKTAGNSLSLALPSREYSALVRTDEKTQLCEIGPNPQWIAELTFSSCEDVAYHQVEIKGEQQQTEVPTLVDAPPQEVVSFEPKENTEGGGPRRLYFNTTFGTGVGFASGWTIKTSTGGIISTREGSGSAWSGMPLRFGVGYFLLPTLAVEVTGRFDSWIARSITEPQSCIDGNLPEDAVLFCDTVPEEQQSTTQAQNGGANPFYYYTQHSQRAWLINARVRYQFLKRRHLVLSVLGGVGYGHIQYRVPSTEADPYFPLIGMVNIEAGIGLNIYFSRYFGLYFELPTIDVLFGDGFAFNTDASLGFSAGF